MITQDQIEEKSQWIQRNINNYIKYKEKLAQLDLSSFKTKSQQKEALELISRTFEELAEADQTGLIIPMWELEEAGKIKEHDELQKIYYSYPHNPYQFTEKRQALIKNHCPHFDDLIELRNLWLKTKSTPIQEKPTKNQTMIQRHQMLMKSIDYSRITDKIAWEVQIDKLIQQYNQTITPVYDRITDDLIDASVMFEYVNEKGISKEEYNKRMTKLLEAHPNFSSIMSYISDKNTKEIASMVENWKQQDLLDTKFKVSKALNFDIYSSKLKTYGSTYKTWIINNNLLLTIETIQAGGYNIQRLHQRTIVKVKKI